MARKVFFALLASALMVASASAIALPAAPAAAPKESVVRLVGGTAIADSLAAIDPTFLVDLWLESPTAAEVRLCARARALLDKLGFAYDVIIDDLDAFWAERFAAIEAKHADPTADFYDTYRTLDEIYERIEGLVAEFPDWVEFKSVGKSIENRDIMLGTFSTDKSANRPVIFWEAQQHAREWVAGMTLMYVVEQLIRETAAGNAAVAYVTSRVDFHWVPIVNVDGYLYSWSNDRFWRKNRRQNTGGSYGVDLNRNWDADWCTAGSSTNPTSDTYCGTAPFSEPETRAMSNYQLSLGSRYVAGIDWHTYGPLILRNFQVNTSICADESRNRACGQQIQSAIQSVHGLFYENIRGVELYPHSGGFLDWAYANFGVIAYTMELRGNSFAPPDSVIILSCEENYAGALAFANYTIAAYAI